MSGNYGSCAVMIQMHCHRCLSVIISCMVVAGKVKAAAGGMGIEQRRHHFPSFLHLIVFIVICCNLNNCHNILSLAPDGSPRHRCTTKDPSRNKTSCTSYKTNYETTSIHVYKQAIRE